LLDTPTVGDHHRQRHSTILGPPPARNPVAAALLFRGAIGEEGHQRLARQGHVRVLQFGETEIAALGDTACGMRIDVTAQRRQRAAVGGLAIAVEILQQAIHALFAFTVGLRLFGVQVAGQQVERIDRRHAMALPHQPGAGPAGQGIQRQVAGIGRHHVQRTAGMPFGAALEVLGAQRRAIEPDMARVGHVHHQPEAGAGNAIDGLQHPVDAGEIRLMPCLYQLVGQAEYGRLGLQRMLERPEAAAPGSEFRLGLGMLIQLGEAGQ